MATLRHRRCQTWAGFKGDKFVTGRDGGDYYSAQYVEWLEERLEKRRALLKRLWDQAVREPGCACCTCDNAISMLSKSPETGFEWVADPVCANCGTPWVPVGAKTNSDELLP